MKRVFRVSDSAPDARREVSDELAFHIEMRAKEFIERGMSPEEARRAALAAFGDVGAVAAECREVREGRSREHRRRDWRHGLAMDVRYALRTLRRSPLFAVTAVLTLALGIGGAAAAFAVVDGVLLRPLPYAEPSRLVMAWTSGQGARGLVTQWPLSAATYLDVQARTTSLQHLAAFRSWPYTLGGEGGGDPELLAGSRARPELWTALGVRPLLGRTFTAEEARPGAPRVAVIGHDLWRRRFGGDPGVLGRAVTLSGERFTIVGVMPPGFAFPRGAELPSGLQFRPRTEVWTPLVFSERDLQLRGTMNLSAVGRLKPGVDVEAASADLARIAAQLVAEHPRFYERIGMHAVPLQEQAAAPVRRGLLLLAGAVGLVLLIACANVANLLVARTAGRAREFAVRVALGATRGRVARQLVTENVLLTLVGAALGVAVAAAGARALLALVPGELPRADDVAVDARVLLVTFAAAVAAGVAFGAAAVLHAGGGASVGAGLQGTRATAGLARRVGRRLLVAAEVALSLVLLVGAGLLTRSFVRLHQVEPGFEPEHAMTAGLLLPIGSTFDPARDGGRWAATFGQYAERLRALPGVVAAGAVSSLPLGGASESTNFGIEGRPTPPGGQQPNADYAPATGGYFRAMGIPLLAGRTFDSRDRADAPGVVIVNDALARKHWPGESAVGKRIFFAAERPIEVVGVVGDVRQIALDVPAAPALYFPSTQFPYPFLTFVVRTTGDPAAVLPLMRRELAALDPSLALHEVRTLRSVLDTSLARQRFAMLVIGAFAAAALLLATVGLYGVIAYSVAQRTREMGVRLALGARPRDVLRLVVGEGARVAAAGVAAGLLGALAAGRLMRSLLYDVSATDLPVYAGVTALVGVVALLASWLPARRAAHVDPTVALRGE